MKWEHTHPQSHECPSGVNYSNTLPLLAHISGWKQVWIGGDAEAWVVAAAVVYGCTLQDAPPMQPGGAGGAAGAGGAGGAVEMVKQLAGGPE